MKSKFLNRKNIGPLLVRVFKGIDSFEASFFQLDGEKMELKSKQDVDDVLKRMNDERFVVQSVNKRERRRNPALPFTTSSLQQEAARKLNFRAKKNNDVSSTAL